MQIVRPEEAVTDTSYLFLVRLWRCESAEQRLQETWEGKVQHVRSGQAHGFESLPRLLEEIHLLLRELESPSLHNMSDQELYLTE